MLDKPCPLCRTPVILEFKMADCLITVSGYIWEQSKSYTKYEEITIKGCLIYNENNKGLYFLVSEPIMLVKWCDSGYTINITKHIFYNNQIYQMMWDSPLNYYYYHHVKDHMKGLLKQLTVDYSDVTHVRITGKITPRKY